MAVCVLLCCIVSLRVLFIIYLFTGYLQPQQQGVDSLPCVFERHAVALHHQE